MKTTNRILLAALLLMASVASYAQTHWTCNPNDFQYDMTVFLTASIDDVALDPTKDEVAAFSGDKCCGVAEALKVGDTYIYYIRVHSNKESGETISFKAYVNGEEKMIKSGTAVVFESHGLHGMPSEAIAFEGVSYISGDVDGDGVVDIVDVTVLIDMVLMSDYGPAADFNGDGDVDILDVTDLIDYILTKLD